MVLPWQLKIPFYARCYTWPLWYLCWEGDQRGWRVKWLIWVVSKCRHTHMQYGALCGFKVKARPSSLWWLKKEVMLFTTSEIRQVVFFAHSETQAQNIKAEQKQTCWWWWTVSAPTHLQYQQTVLRFHSQGFSKYNIKKKIKQAFYPI